MADYIASNGMRIRRAAGMLNLWSKRNTKLIGGGPVGEALEEYIQTRVAAAREERDRVLGRWRWPENPDYVVYPTIEEAHEMAFGKNLSVMVFHEPTGVLKGYCRDEDRGGEGWQEYPNAARAFFDAHPEPKPWHDAKPGEVWVLLIDGEDVVCTVSSSGPDFQPVDHPVWATLSRGSDHITAGRLIWPETS